MLMGQTVFVLEKQLPDEKFDFRLINVFVWFDCEAPKQDRH